MGAPIIDPVMPLSMRSLLSADTFIPEAVRAGIAAGDPGSATQLMALGLTECEAAELLDDPCEAPSGRSGSCAGPWC
jgi:ABC-type amino acid transport system permease subunit